MKEVTNPELIKQLEAARTGGGKKIREAVSDPSLIKQLDEKRGINLGGAGASLAQIPDDIREMTGDAANYIRDAVTGRGRYDPEIAKSGELGNNLEGTTLGQSAKIAAAYATSPDPVAIADIAEKTLPGSKRKIDQYNNQIIEWNGKDYYINRPGASSSDAYKLLADTAAFYPAARISATMANLWARAGLAIPAFFTTSVGQDLAAQGLGSDQPVDLERATFASAGGVVGEFLAPTVLKLWRSLFSSRQFYRGGKLTPQGEAAAKQAGLNPDDMGSAEAQIFGSNLRYAADRYGAEAPNVAAGRTQSGEFGVKLSKGQRTQDPAQLRRESLASQGASTDEAQAAMRNADLEQQLALARAADDIGEELNPQATMGSSRDAAEALQQRTRSQYEDVRKGASDAYNKVEAATNQPSFQKQSVIDMRNQMTKKFREDFGFSYSADLQPRVAKVIKRLRQFVPERVRRRNFPFYLGELERLRRSINKQIDGAPNQERVMLTSLKRDFDSWMDTAIEKAMVDGDTAVIDQLKKARGLWSNYRQTFGVNAKTGDAGGKFVQKILDPQTAPEEVVKGIFGVTRAYPSNSPRIIAKLKQALGEGGMAEVREMGWTTIVDKAISDSVQGGSRKLSPQKFVTAFQKAMKENLTAMKQLYSETELQKMRRFASLAERTIRPTTNPSGTVAGLSTVIRDLAKNYFTIIGFTQGIGPGVATRVGLDAAENIIGKRRAGRMLNPKDPAGKLPAVPTILGGVVPGQLSNRPEPPVR